jgi:UrcA family protein
MFAAPANSSFTNLPRTLLAAAGAFAFAGLCLVGAAGPAAAAEPTRSKVVSYADLDLGSPKGQKELRARIRMAAHEVCRQPSRDAWARAMEAQCFLDAVDETRNATLAAIETSKVG